MDDRDLTRLLDEAAAAYEPVRSPGRLALALAPRPTTGRRLYLVIGVAGLTALGAGVAALTGAETAIRTPADQFKVDVTIERSVPVAIATTTVPMQTSDDDPAAKRPRLIVAPVTDEDDAASRELADHAVLLVHEPTLPAHEPDAAPAATTSSTTTTTEPQPTTTAVPAPVAVPVTAPATTHAPATTQPPTPPPAPTTTHAPVTTTQPPHQDPPPTTTAPAIAFTAYQFWGSCNSDPPYDEFEGHASPGSTVSISSPYGSASTTADTHGNWYVKVLVPDAPVGETFTFVASSSAGGSATFSFVRTG